MSYITDFKSAPFSIFGVNGGITDTNPQDATLCGTRWDTADGRELALVQVGATAIVAGVLVQSPATLANFVSLVTVGTQAIGSTSLVVTLGGTAVLVNEFAGGMAIISAGTGIGQTSRIASHTVQASTTGNTTLTLEDPWTVALDATSTVTMILPQYGSQNGTVATAGNAALGVIIQPTTVSGRTLGASFYALPASTTTVPSYGFIVTRGICGVLNQGSTAVGLDLMPSASVAGAVCTYVVATKTRVGTSPIAGVDTAVQAVTIQL